MVPNARAALQTFHAIQASDLATAFNDALKRARVGPGDYGAELTAPDGPSTAGGVQAMQRIRLVARQPGHPTLVVGYANHAEERAELRSYDHLDAVHRQRFREPLALDRVQYNAFLRLAKQILEVLHLRATITTPPFDLGPADGPASPRRTGWMIALALAILAGGGGFGLWRAGLLEGALRALGKG